MEKHITAPITKEETAKLFTLEIMYMSTELFILPEMQHISGWTKHWTEAKNYQLISKIRQFIIWDHLLQERASNWICRTDNRQPYGQICTTVLDLGQTAMIGKGKRSQAVIDAVVRNGCVYLAAIGGAGALLSKCIKSSEVVAYEDLGTEAIRKLQVENLPVIVVIDSEGNNLYETAIRGVQKI